MTGKKLFILLKTPHKISFEKMRFMIYTTAHHQGAVKICFLVFCRRASDWSGVLGLPVRVVGRRPCKLGKRSGVTGRAGVARRDVQFGGRSKAVTGRVVRGGILQKNKDKPKNLISKKYSNSFKSTLCHFYLKIPVSVAPLTLRPQLAWCRTIYISLVACPAPS